MALPLFVVSVKVVALPYVGAAAAAVVVVTVIKVVTATVPVMLGSFLERTLKDCMSLVGAIQHVGASNSLVHILPVHNKLRLSTKKILSGPQKPTTRCTVEHGARSVVCDIENAMVTDDNM